MSICAWVLFQIFTIVRVTVALIIEVVEHLCGWVTTTTTKIKDVCHDVCSALGLGWLCRTVCTPTEVLEETTEWVCEDVIKPVLVWLEILVEVVIFVVGWICWVLSTPARAILWVLCYIGVKVPVQMRLCVKILADEFHIPVMSAAEAKEMVNAADEIFGQCDISLTLGEISVVSKPAYLKLSDVAFASPAFTWFSKHACPHIFTITVYVIQDFAGSEGGGAMPGTNWLLVDTKWPVDKRGIALAHEICHLCMLAHVSDPDNLMTNEPGGTRNKITPSQCCTIRTSGFVSVI